MSFQVDLEYLDTAARLHLPNLAKEYSTVSNEVANAGEIAQNAASDPPVCPDGAAFAKGWMDLRVQIMNALTGCADNATKIGGLLAHTVDVYAATDAQILAGMNSLNEKLQAQVQG